jgi:hypothetical protein
LFYCILLNHTRFEVYMVVKIFISVFWVVIPCSLVQHIMTKMTTIQTTKPFLVVKGKIVPSSNHHARRSYRGHEVKLCTACRWMVSSSLWLLYIAGEDTYGQFVSTETCMYRVLTGPLSKFLCGTVVMSLSFSWFKNTFFLFHCMKCFCTAFCIRAIYIIIQALTNNERDSNGDS